MRPENISTRANATHFGHAEATHGHNPPPQVPSAHSGKVESKKAPEIKAQPTQQSQSQTACVFSFEAANAKSVQVAGEFTKWEKSPIKMTKGKNGTWEAKVQLAPGRHTYRFIVDGEWQDDPKAKDKVANPFGSYDAIVEVATKV